MECSLQPQSTTDGVSVLATMPPTPPPSIDQVVKPTSMDHLVKLRVHAIETCKTNGRATFCYHHSVRPKLVGSTEKVVAVGCGSWPQRLAPSARPLAPQRCSRSLPRRGHCLCRLGRCRLLTPDARQGPLLEWHRAALAPQRCPRSHPRRCHCLCPLCRCRLLTPDARQGLLLLDCCWSASRSGKGFASLPSTNGYTHVLQLSVTGRALSETGTPDALSKTGAAVPTWPATSMPRFPCETTADLKTQ